MAVHIRPVGLEVVQAEDRWVPVAVPTEAGSHLAPDSVIVVVAEFAATFGTVVVPVVHPDEATDAAVVDATADANLDEVRPDAADVAVDGEIDGAADGTLDERDIPKGTVREARNFRHPGRSAVVRYSGDKSEWMPMGCSWVESSERKYSRRIRMSCWTGETSKLRHTAPARVRDSVDYRNSAGVHSVAGHRAVQIARCSLSEEVGNFEPGRCSGNLGKTAEDSFRLD